MNRALRMMGYLLAGIFVLLLLLVGVLAVVTRRPFPQTDGTLTVPGVKDDVHIYRDSYGIPHIYANSMEDLFFAQGFVHAQDRFWQMEWWRHIGQGRLSEIAGAGTLDNDKFIRTMGWNRMAQTTVDYYRENEPAYYAILEAYAAGVNAYIADKSPGELSLNYTVLQMVNEPWEIEPWTPVNTVSWGVVMSFDLANDINRELTYARMIDQFGEEAVAALLPSYPYDTRPVIAPTDQLVSEAAHNGALAGWPTAVKWQNVNTTLIGQAPQVLGGDSFVGSNNWVISGQHTDTGLPLLANDPHLGIQMPAIWYEVGLHAPGFDAVGFSFAGVPGIVIGHNNDIAWGVTNAGADVQDLYIERLEGERAEYMGQLYDLEIHEEVIKVNGGDDVVLPVRITRHGPIISDVLDDADDVLAVRWVQQEPSRILQAVLLLNQASNYQEFRDALRYWDIPSQNVIYADREGNIAYQMPGLIPIRKSGLGLVPSPGWTDTHEWEGWVPFEALPALFNPEQGYISTANHAIVDLAYPYYLTRDWADGDRGQRIVEMIDAHIAAGDKITQEDIAAIQNDNMSLLAKTYVPFLANLQTEDQRVQAAVDVLRTWDGQEVRDSAAAAIFESFYVQLYPAILADEIGEDNVEDVHSNIFLHQIALDPTAPWWDNINTPEKESREAILLQAFTQALDWLDDNMPGDIDSWTWGRMHTATFTSLPLGESGIAPVESLVNRGPFPADGGRSIVNAMSWSPDNPAVIKVHPSMRMILDLSDFDASRTIIPTGQSGHPGHPLYGREMALWLNGEYHPLWWTETAVTENAVDHLILRP